MDKYNVNDYNKASGSGMGGQNTNLSAPVVPLGEGCGTYSQYPEAIFYNYPQDSTPAMGVPLYPPAEVNANPVLKRFVKQGFKDLWAAVLFVIAFFVIPVWFIVVNAMQKNVLTPVTVANTTDISSDMDNKAIMPIVYGSCISLCTSIISLVLIMRFPVEIIYITCFMVLCFYCVCGILFIVNGIIIAGILSLLCLVLQLVWFYCVRSRIPFTGLLMKSTAEVLWKHWTIFVLNIILVILLLGYFVLWFFVQRSIIVDKSRNNNLLYIGFGINAFILFWVTQVSNNLMHVTAAGVVATWYYVGISNMPANPILAAFNRAITTSFGSICFGSLFVAIIQRVRWIIESENDSFIHCIVDCLLEIIEYFVKLFNTYAFVHVAIYGCGYVEAAKRTFDLCQQCFCEMLFNHSLVIPTLNILTFALSLILGVSIGFFLQNVVIGVCVFLVASIIHSSFFMAVASGAVTIFVCFAESPDALQNSNPDLYALIHAASTEV